MKIFAIRKLTILRLLFLLITVLLILCLAATQNTSSAMNAYSLDKSGCRYAIDDLVGQYSIKVGGVGLAGMGSRDGSHQGSFAISNVNGTPYKAYLYWTLRKQAQDYRIQIQINDGPLRNVIASGQDGQSFGPAVLFGASTTYWGYMVDLTPYINQSELRIGDNNFSIRKNLGNSDTEIFGAGVMLIHRDASQPSKHIEVKCGFDGIYYESGNQTTATKWGEWSNVVCHEFTSTSTNRQIDYYAFLSGTSNKTSTNYRPNALWYVSGSNTSLLNNIKSLNKPQGLANLGLSNIPGHKEQQDIFYGISGNEWDSLHYTNNQLQIPSNHNFICFQTQSIHSWLRAIYGQGSSMQWSMSALSFSSAPDPAVVPTPTDPPANPPSDPSDPNLPTLTPTTTPIPTATPPPTATPTPIIYYPWVNTVGGNLYSQTFSQTPLSPGKAITNSTSETANLVGIPAFLSTDLYMQPLGNAAPNQASLRNAHRTNYTDSNSHYKSTITWFAYLSQYLRNSTLDISLKSLNNSDVCSSNTCTISKSTTSEFHPSIGSIAVHTFSGDLTININSCNTKSIFVIDGDLTITPNLITQGYENGCMFIVSGTTTISDGTPKGSADAIPNTVYDEVHGLFVTNDFVTASDPAGDGLYIKGGIVETAANPNGDLYMELNRDLGIIRNRYSPSEIIKYDPRYLYIYGDLLTYVYGYNIREGQFIRTL